MISKNASSAASPRIINPAKAHKKRTGQLAGPFYSVQKVKNFLICCEKSAGCPFSITKALISNATLLQQVTMERRLFDC